jgi:hypothetical protein
MLFDQQLEQHSQRWGAKFDARNSRRRSHGCSTDGDLRRGGAATVGRFALVRTHHLPGDRRFIARARLTVRATIGDCW